MVESPRRPGPPGTALLAALVMAVAAGPVLNHGLSAAAPELREILGISRSSFGMLASALFVSAALSSLVVGRLAHRWSYRAQLLVNFGGTALAFIVAAIGPTYVLLMAAAVIGGLTQSMANPTTNLAMYDFVPAEKRARWVGIKQSGVQVSQLVTGLFLPLAIVVLSWTGAALAAAAMVLVAYWWAQRQFPESVERVAARTRPLPDPGEPSRRAPTPVVWALTAGAFLAGAGTQATNVYLVLFAHEDLAQPVWVGGLAMALVGVLGVTARVAWSMPIQRGVPSRRILAVVSVGSLGAAFGMVVAAVADSTAAFWIAAILHGSCVLSVNVVIFNAIFEVADVHEITGATGFVTMGMYAGFALGPLVMGHVVETAGGFAGGWIVTGGIYAGLVALALTLALRGRPGAGG